MKISEMNGKGKYRGIIIVIPQNAKLCMDHFEKQDLRKYDVFPFSNVDPDSICK